MTPTLQSFPMGANVPEWLLDLRPKPGSVRGKFRFATDVDVIETEHYFVIVPTADVFTKVLDDSGTTGCAIAAADKPVHLLGIIIRQTGDELPLWSQ